MKLLIIGLGNPGEKYHTTRHNAGVMFLDTLNPAFESNSKLQADIAQVVLGTHEVMVMKSHTFMNNSGQAVRAVADYYKIPHENIWVVHDDKDISLGKLKLCDSCPEAGHNGVTSITQHLGDNVIKRLRIGVDGGLDRSITPTDVYVLQRFSEEEMKRIDGILNTAHDMLEMAIDQGIEKAQNEFHSFEG